MSNIVQASAITAETLEMAKAAFAKGPSVGPGLQKAGINIAENLVGINLEAPSKKLFPVYSPLRNRFARIQAPAGATAVQWRAIREINSENVWPGVAENTRNGFNTTLTESKSATFKTLGHDDYVGFEALARSKSFEDVRATAALNLLYSVMISEEKVLLGGNAVDIGAPVGVTGVASNTADGALASGTYYVAVSSLVLRGFDKAEKADAVAEADGESDVVSSTGIVIAGANDTITATWAAVKGAVAYNVFTDDGSGMKYHSTVTVCEAVITAVGTGAAPNTSDLTGSALEFDGVISFIEKNASAGLFIDQESAPLTSDGSGGITEFDDVLQEMWDTYRLGPTCILVNAQQARDITKKIGGSSNLSYRIYLEDGQRNVVGGIFVGAYLNKFASSFAEGFPAEIPIKIHPNLPPGTILFIVETLPYPNNQVPNVWEVETLQEYTQYEWALSQRRYEFGIYSQEVLKSYYDVAQAAIVCVSPG
jgi:hypothetical protein